MKNDYLHQFTVDPLKTSQNAKFSPQKLTTQQLLNKYPKIGPTVQFQGLSSQLALKSRKQNAFLDKSSIEGSTHNTCDAVAAIQSKRSNQTKQHKQQDSSQFQTQNKVEDQKLPEYQEKYHIQAYQFSQKHLMDQNKLLQQKNAQLEQLLMQQQQQNSDQQIDPQQKVVHFQQDQKQKQSQFSQHPVLQQNQSQNLLINQQQFQQQHIPMSQQEQLAKTLEVEISFSDLIQDQDIESRIDVLADRLLIRHPHLLLSDCKALLRRCCVSDPAKRSKCLMALFQ